MFNIVFPQKTNQRYYDIHYLYVLNVFKYLNCNISYEVRSDFIVTINGKDFLFDYWDTNEIQKSDLPTFKFHTLITDIGKVIPFPPVSFYDWQQYNWLSKQIYYIPTMGFDISCRQRPYADALIRRIKVQNLLKDSFPNVGYAYGEGCHVLTDIIDQVKYWREINEIECAVFVPGQNNHILDRGQLQYLAFGCYTISPSLPEVLPFNRLIVPGTHYVQCKDDYSDLVDIIMRKRINSNQSPYKQIGENAKQLFNETCTPEVLGKWIQQHIK